MKNLDFYLEKASEMFATYAPKFILAVLTLVIGLYVISRIVRMIKKVMTKRDVNPSLRSFLTSIASIGLKVLLVVSVLGMVGVEMTSFIAILAAAGLAVGMALSGTLQNFAGGVMILIFKPFEVGDYIEAQGYQGVVDDIQIFNTFIKTVDNKKVILPNGNLSTNAMVNYTAEEERRVDFTFGIGYGDDIDKAKAVMQSLVDANDLILKTPESFIALSELADSSVNFTVRVWTKTPNYWDVYFYMHEAVKKAFDKDGVSIPFPQTDVHLHKVN